jgi:Uncharacterized protein conserved in bacteria (DUF2188)
MSQGKNQHIVPHGSGWAILGAGNEKVTRQFETQREAIEHGRQIAINQQSELIIHNQEGQIRERNSYGNDPFPPAG